jgi:hypothetical protein
MSDLYTSQVHLKRLLAGRATAAFTPAPEAVLKMLDPTFFPGMGALNEDESGRVQCPVRGCGAYFLTGLGNHLGGKHPTIGAAGVRIALGIPLETPLLSAKGKEEQKRLSTIPNTRRFATQKQGERARRKRRAAEASGPVISMSRLNFADSCPAQTAEKVAALAEELGHVPTFAEFVAKVGPDARSAVLGVFGTWGNLLANCGLSTRGRSTGNHGSIGVADLVESLRTWVEAHGDLPSARECQRPDRAPVIPSYPTILRVMGVDNWSAAMRSAVEHLGINSERYGSPKRRSA